ncbi:MAG TPA: AraC family transcriptional regulator [Opitutales bacterium]|nr:AraC family transcriptional regulator [Opitutales bacterium]
MELYLDEHEDALDAREAFFQSLAPGQWMEKLFDMVPGAYFFVKDRKSRFMGGSEDFARTLGEARIEAMIGRTDYDFSPDFLADAFYEDDQRVMGTGQPIFNQVELVPSADGSLDWLCTSKIPLRNHGGEVVGMAGVTRIISDSDAVYADNPEMRRIVDYVRAHYREKLSVADMAQVGGISVSSQERLFRKIFGLTPLMYLRKTRLNAACKLLRDSPMGLSDIAVQCGFNDQTNMTRAFRLELKITPLRYRRRFSNQSGDSSQRGFHKLNGEARRYAFANS